MNQRSEKLCSFFTPLGVGTQSQVFEIYAANGIFGEITCQASQRGAWLDPTMRMVNECMQ